MVRVLAFDVFGTVVDWHGSIVRHVQRIGLDVEPNEFALAWRAGYAPAMEKVSAMARPTDVTDRNRKPNGLELSYSDVVMFIDSAIQEGAVTAPLRLEPIRFIGPAGDQPLPELGEPEIIPIPDR